MRGTTPLLLFLLLAPGLGAQITVPEAPQAAGRAAVLDPIQGGWGPMARAEEVRADADVIDAGMSIQARWNELRMTRNELLAQRTGNLNNADKALLRERAADLARMAPASFEAHMAGYYAEFPAPAAFDALRAAHTASPDRSELPGPMLGAALREDDERGLAFWAKRLQDPGMVTRSLLEVAGDLLLSVDRDGILITNGDMDTYPALVRIHADKQRTDVLLIDQRLLDDADYRTRCWAKAAAKGPVPRSGPAFAAQLAGATKRSVFLALSLDRSWLDAHAANLYCTGLAFRFGSVPADHFHLLEQRWKAMRKPADAGPLGRNYLLPGSLLLVHYREIGDESRAAALEFELRQFATRTGSLDRLYKAGVLTH